MYVQHPDHHEEGGEEEDEEYYEDDAAEEVAAAPAVRNFKKARNYTSCRPKPSRVVV